MYSEYNGIERHLFVIHKGRPNLKPSYIISNKKPCMFSKAFMLIRPVNRICKVHN